MNRVLIGEVAREKILSGANILCTVVKTTIGPKGRNVILGEGAIITNDGVTIANAVRVEDPIENLGVEILRQASQKTNQQVGDGTTSVILLANEILIQSNKKIIHGKSPILLKDELLGVGKLVTDFVSKLSLKCDEYKTLLAVTTNSCASVLGGKLVADAIEHVGTEGVVIIEENTRGVTELAFSDGLECPFALSSPYFAQNTERLESVIQDARLLVYDGVIQSVKEVVSILELVQKKGIKLCIIAKDFSHDVVAALVLNRVRANIDIVAVKINTTTSEAVLGDIAAVTNSVIVGSQNDLNLGQVTEEHLGSCRKIISGMSGTKILAYKNEDISKSIKNRVSQIRGQITACKDEYMEAKLRERLARLTNGMAVISVGLPTQIETRELKLRLDDALHAGLAAKRGGIIAGGGVAYLRAAQEINNHCKNDGAAILAQSLSCILKQICLNASVSADVVLEKVIKSELGYDASKGVFVDMIAANIIDPTEVIKSVITNAISVAATLITTEAVVF